MDRRMSDWNQLTFEAAMLQSAHTSWRGPSRRVKRTAMVRTHARRIFRPSRWSVVLRRYETPAYTWFNSWRMRRKIVNKYTGMLKHLSISSYTLRWKIAVGGNDVDKDRLSLTKQQAGRLRVGGEVQLRVFLNMVQLELSTSHFDHLC
jgi:hypothetical protein